jgi:hypothetical protein
MDENTAIKCVLKGSLLPLFSLNLFNTLKMIKYKKLQAIAVDKDESRFTLLATSLKGNIMSNILPSTTKNGVPGGCGTPSICEQAMNSPQSQRDTVGAIV